jgi:hypothetical protein
MIIKKYISIKNKKGVSPVFINKSVTIIILLYFSYLLIVKAPYILNLQTNVSNLINY